MSFAMSDKPQILRVYNLRADTHEFIGAGDAYIAPHTGLPANCTLCAPPEIPTSYVAVWDEQSQAWSLVEDHRGTTVYRTDTAEAVFIDSLGPLPENTVLQAPNGEYERWDGSQWVKDPVAEKQAQIEQANTQKNMLLRQAGERIAPLQDAVDLDMASTEETALLADLKRYRVLLSRVDTHLAPDIDWPLAP
ncbi:tail fiber assembly protein [Plesiomonas shigelloides]